MNRFNRFFFTLCVLVMATSGLGQNYKEIAYNYIRVEDKLGNDFNFSEANIYKFLNGNVIVNLTVERKYTEREEFVVPDGYVINYQDSHGRIRTTKKAYKDHERTAAGGYYVFVSKSGKPLRYMHKGAYQVRYLPNTMWVIEHGRSKMVGEKWLSYFDTFKCYSSEGALIEEKKDMAIYCIEETPNFFYLVGEISTPRGSRSIVRIVNRKTNSHKDILGKLGEIDYNIEFHKIGIVISKLENDGNSTTYIIPYEADDEDFIIQQAMEGYDLTQPSGQVKLGELYLVGDVIRRNLNKAFKSFEKAASQNDEKGLLRLAEFYLNGWGVTQNVSSAINCYEKCANLGNKDAIKILSDLYFDGKFIDKDMPMVLYWKERLALLDDEDAQMFIIKNSSKEYKYALNNPVDALELARKNVKSKNRPWAKFCYERAISLGSKDAAFEYGKRLYEGNGIERDASKAIKILGGISENVEAQKLLALMYRENFGIVPDVQQEMYWIQKAAENGDADSQLRLGSAYLNGVGVSKIDKTLSAEWYEKAAKRNNQEAIRYTIKNYMNGNGVKKDVKKAAYYITCLNHQSQLAYANDALNGNGIKKDKKLAISIFENLAAKGNKEAKLKLALCYLAGDGVSKNIEKAYQLAMDVRNATHDGENGDIYYIEAMYLEKKYNEPSGRASDAYRNAIKFGCQKAVKDFARYQRKFGLSLSLNGRSY